MRTPHPLARLLATVTVGGLTAAIAMSATSAAGIGAAEAAPTTGTTAKVWLSTPDGAHQLSSAGTVAFGSDEPTVPTVVVDPTRTYQTMQGFGASITDSSAALLYNLSPAAREATMRSLFDPETGNGLSYLRQPIGGSDFVATAHYTYNDLPAGGTDFEQRRFSIAHDKAQILPLLRRAKALNPRLKVMASPWSPPAWMKTSGSLVGGQLIDQDRIYRAYALYLVRFVQSYAANGVPVDALAVQNEPQNRKPFGYPGTDMPSWQQEKVIERLGPMLRKAGLSTKILAYDHNWAMHPDDIAATPPDQAGDVDRYVENVLESPAARWIDGVAYHCYYGDPSAMTRLHRQFPDQAIYFTECSGSQSSNPDNTYSDTLKWHSRNLIIGSTRNWAETVINWNLALDPSGGPHVGGCDTCTGVVTIGSDGSVTNNAEYYTLGHLARFVEPGAVRIASTSFGTTGWNGQVMDVAFRNPDGSTVLVAHNENDNPQTFAVRQGDQSFTYTLPGGALATFTWAGDPGGSPALRQVAPAGWSATADPSGPTNLCCSGDVAANAVDDDATTRFSTGTGQTPGQYLQVDFGRPLRARQVVFDTGIGLGDHPRRYTVATSQDATTWTTVVPSAAGHGQFTTVDLPGAPIRYVRITLTEAAPDSWWSVADVRAYTDRHGR
ncbi:glycoside hydrolase family 30 beta sandwich domain-containing protein [Nocardioides astragali]|uniref:Glycoside hydrolase family 30 beta sandwich domain-containing protein n=1 Tax=Nocardioides astragali TaxID=1776736 RepID=A0ABW2N7U3_9ACTN|nr:glycoside hydrolase family 30 beta sandwich domain-containing protein [Nocardioides astragali]